MTESCFDWQTGEFWCPRCLTREPVALPMPLDAFAVEAKAFARAHQRCREPIGPGERAWLRAAQAYRVAGHKVNEAVQISGLDRVGMIGDAAGCMRMAVKARKDGR